MTTRQAVKFIFNCVKNGITIPDGIVLNLSDYHEIFSSPEDSQEISELLENLPQIAVKSNSELENITREVLKECARQDAKWGVAVTQHPLVWNCILGEERGEVEREINESDFQEIQGPNYEVELTQVAAVAIQAILSNRILKLKIG